MSYNITHKLLTREISNLLFAPHLFSGFFCNCKIMTEPFPEFTYQTWMEIRKYTLFSPCHFGLWFPFPAHSLFLLILHFSFLKSVLTMGKFAALVFLVYSPRTIRCSPDFDWFYLIIENVSRQRDFFWCGAYDFLFLSQKIFVFLVIWFFYFFFHIIRFFWQQGSFLFSFYYFSSWLKLHSFNLIFDCLLPFSITNVIRKRKLQI